MSVSQRPACVLCCSSSRWLRQVGAKKPEASPYEFVRTLSPDSVSRKTTRGRLYWKLWYYLGLRPLRQSQFISISPPSWVISTSKMSRRFCSSPSSLLSSLNPEHLVFEWNGLFLAGLPVSHLWIFFLKYHYHHVFFCLKKTTGSHSLPNLYSSL